MPVGRFVYPEGDSAQFDIQKWKLQSLKVSPSDIYLAVPRTPSESTSNSSEEYDQLVFTLREVSAQDTLRTLQPIWGPDRYQLMFGLTHPLPGLGVSINPLITEGDVVCVIAVKY
jgi:hypothetical protein